MIQGSFVDTSSVARTIKVHLGGGSSAAGLVGAMLCAIKAILIPCAVGFFVGLYEWVCPKLPVIRTRNTRKLRFVRKDAGNDYQTDIDTTNSCQIEGES